MIQKNNQSQILKSKLARAVSRRWFFHECGVGMGTIALHSLINAEVANAKMVATADPLAPRQPHFPGKAKNVIYLFMAGAPSHLELFDKKPQLAK